MIKINIQTGHPLDATSFYRAFGVWNELSRGTDIQLFNDGSISWADTCKYDLLFMHRPYNSQHLDFIKTAQMCGVPVWADWDDDVINIPRHNPAYSIYSVNSMTDILNSKAHITVSTQGMRDNYGRGDVIINYPPVPLDFVKPQKTTKFRILWRGSNTHEADWMTAVKPLSDFLKDKKNVEFLTIGALPYFAEVVISKLVPIRKLNTLRIYDYFDLLKSSQQADVIFIPLADDKFNYAKSNCAAQEGLLTGATSVQPSFNSGYGYPYTDMLEALENCYADWNDNYLVFKEEIMADQEKVKENKKIMQEKRMETLNKLIKL